MWLRRLLPRSFLRCALKSSLLVQLLSSCVEGNAGRLPLYVTVASMERRLLVRSALLYDGGGGGGSLAAWQQQ